MHLFQWLSSYRHPSPLLIPFSQTLMETMQFIFFFCKTVFIVSYNIHTLSLFVSISIASTFRRSQVFTVGLFSSTFSSFVRYTRIDCCTDIVNLSHKAIHRVVDWWIPLSSVGVSKVHERLLYTSAVSYCWTGTIKGYIVGLCNKHQWPSVAEIAIY